MDLCYCILAYFSHYYSFRDMQHVLQLKHLDLRIFIPIWKRAHHKQLDPEMSYSSFPKSVHPNFRLDRNSMTK